MERIKLVQKRLKCTTEEQKQLEKCLEILPVVLYSISFWLQYVVVGAVT